VYQYVIRLTILSKLIELLSNEFVLQLQGPHPLYKPTKEKIVPPRDSLCQELQGDQNYCETCKQCDYEIEYADRSSSMGVLAKDDMHLITTDGGREKLDYVFGYGQTFE
jgi:hypothetical protein